jgi:hypothetical protein
VEERLGAVRRALEEHAPVASDVVEDETTHGGVDGADAAVEAQGVKLVLRPHAGGGEPHLVAAGRPGEALEARELVGGEEPLPVPIHDHDPPPIVVRDHALLEGEPLAVGRDADPVHHVVERAQVPADRVLEVEASPDRANDGELREVGVPVGGHDVLEDLPRGPAGERGAREDALVDERHLGRRHRLDPGLGNVQRAAVPSLAVDQVHAPRLALPGGDVDDLPLGTEPRRRDRPATEGHPPELRGGRPGRRLKGSPAHGEPRDHHRRQRHPAPPGGGPGEGSALDLDGGALSVRRLRRDRTGPLVDRGRGADALDRSAHPAVAPPGERLHVARVYGAVAEGGADLADAEVQRLLEIDEGAGGPDLRLHLLARHHVAGAAGQQRQHLEGLRLKAHEGPAPAQLPGSEIHFEHAEAEEVDVGPLARSRARLRAHSLRPRSGNRERPGNPAVWMRHAA